MAGERGQNGDEGARELEREQLGGPADYDESGGAGLEPRPGDQVIGGGVSGGDEDPIGEPGLPDEAAGSEADDRSAAQQRGREGGASRPADSVGTETGRPADSIGSEPSQRGGGGGTRSERPSGAVGSES